MEIRFDAYTFIKESVVPVGNLGKQPTIDGSMDDDRPIGFPVGSMIKLSKCNVYPYRPLPPNDIVWWNINKFDKRQNQCLRVCSALLQINVLVPCEEKKRRISFI